MAGRGLVLTFVLGISSGAVISVNGQHRVGATAPGAEGLPILGWSRSGGDLRVAHFLGLHAMHILPGVALVAGWFAPHRARAVVTFAAVALVALTVVTCAQALAGRPFLPLFG